MNGQNLVFQVQVQMLPFEQENQQNDENNKEWDFWTHNRDNLFPSRRFSRSMLFKLTNQFFFSKHKEIF